MRAWWCVALVACLGLSGCAEDAGEANRPLNVVTDPNDYSYLDNQTLAAGAHLHDYWGGKDSLTVVSASRGTFWNTVGDGWWTLLFEPADGIVVPQGTARVEVTVDWSDGSLADAYGAVELLVRTAATSEPLSLGEVRPGDTVVYEAAYNDSDLPHQQLSAWDFLVRLHTGSGPASVFTGNVALEAVAHRGHDLVPFPAHPDHWQGRTELPLLEDGRTFQQVRYGGFTGQSDPVHRPADGALVPPKAGEVVVTVTEDAETPTRLQLGYHGAASRQWTWLAPDEDDGSTRVYRIPVDGDADGPYAEQSLWEFSLRVERPAADAAFGAWRGSYAVSAVVLHTSVA